MKDTDIVAELDALKLRILIDGVEKQPSDLERYEKWVDELMGRGIGFCEWKRWHIHDPREYSECKTIASVVQDLFHKKHSLDGDYHKNRPEIQRIVREVVFMTKFVEKEHFNKEGQE
jgi:hypothetical protein